MMESQKVLHSLGCFALVVALVMLGVYVTCPGHSQMDDLPGYMRESRDAMKEMMVSKMMGMKGNPTFEDKQWSGWAGWAGWGHGDGDSEWSGWAGWAKWGHDGNSEWSGWAGWAEWAGWGHNDRDSEWSPEEKEKKMEMWRRRREELMQDFPPEERDQMVELWSRHKEDMMEVWREYKEEMMEEGRAWTPEEKERMMERFRERKEEMMNNLTPEEKELMEKWRKHCEEKMQQYRQGMEGPDGGFGDDEHRPDQEDDMPMPPKPSRPKNPWMQHDQDDSESGYPRDKPHHGDGPGRDVPERGEGRRPGRPQRGDGTGANRGQRGDGTGANRGQRGDGTGANRGQRGDGTGANRGQRGDGTGSEGHQIRKRRGRMESPSAKAPRHRGDKVHAEHEDTMATWQGNANDHTDGDTNEDMRAKMMEMWREKMNGQGDDGENDGMREKMMAMWKEKMASHGGSSSFSGKHSNMMSAHHEMTKYLHGTISYGFWQACAKVHCNKGEWGRTPEIRMCFDIGSKNKFWSKEMKMIPKTLKEPSWMKTSKYLSVIGLALAAFAVLVAVVDRVVGCEIFRMLPTVIMAVFCTVGGVLTAISTITFGSKHCSSFLFSWVMESDIKPPGTTMDALKTVVSHNEFFQLGATFYLGVVAAVLMIVAGLLFVGRIWALRRSSKEERLGDIQKEASAPPKLYTVEADLNVIKVPL